MAARQSDRDAFRRHLGPLGHRLLCRATAAASGRHCRGVVSGSRTRPGRCDPGRGGSAGMTETEILKARIAQQDAQLRILATELAETNRGVVALYAELDDNATQLRDAADLKSRFLSYMSHEFRTPLASISSIAHILLAGLDGSLTAEQLRQVQFVQGSVRELTEMVDDLLDLAKVEAGRITI